MVDQPGSLETNLLRTLMTLSDASGVPEASRRLGISQPAVRSHIARLQHLFGDPLFETSNDQTVLTDIGEHILETARRIIEDAKMAPSAAALDAKSGVRLGISSIFAENFAKDVGGLAEDELSISSAVCTELANAFVDRRVDVAMVLDVRDNRQKLSAHLVDEHPVEMVWIKAAGLILDPERPIPMAFWPGDRIAVTALEEAGCDYRILFRTNDYATKLSAVRSGNYISIAPRHAVAPPLVEADDKILPKLPRTNALIAVRGGIRDARMRQIVSKLADAYC